MPVFMFNVVKPRAPRARTHTVAVRFCLAESKAEAAKRVAAEEPNGTLIAFRNEVDADSVLTWTFQTWSPADVKEQNCHDVRELAPFKYAGLADT